MQQPTEVQKKGNMKYKYAQWETASSRPGLNGICHCGKKADMLAIAEEDTSFDSEDMVIKALCNEHFNKQTQKQWIKKWRKTNA